MTLTELNALPREASDVWFYSTCGCQHWAQAMSAGRPYTTVAQIKQAATANWQRLSAEHMLEAFAAHPMIGDMSTLKAKFANTKDMASNEQSGTSVASDSTLKALHQANHEYLDKNGFIFIICATGLSAEHMLNELKVRLNNDSSSEIKNAANEQIKITLLRINKGIVEEQ